MELENNAYFWQKLDTLFFSSDLVIDRPKGTTHPKYSNLVYPVDYGKLKGILATDEEEIDIYVGTKGTTTVDAIVVCADILKKDIEVKLLVACSKEEEYSILAFLNQTDFQKTIIVRRGEEIPVWAMEN